MELGDSDFEEDWESAENKSQQFEDAIRRVTEEGETILR
jgi:hypothetical protein